MTSSTEFVFFKNIHFERYIMELSSDTTFWSSPLNHCPVWILLIRSAQVLRQDMFLRLPYELRFVLIICNFLSVGFDGSPPTYRIKAITARRCIFISCIHGLAFLMSGELSDIYLNSLEGMGMVGVFQRIGIEVTGIIYVYYLGSQPMKSSH